MTERNSLVEEAIIQMKNLEDIIAENAKGILASTMKQEIKDLVKESLNEADEDEEEIEDTDMEDDVDMEMDSEEDDEDMPMGPEMDGDDETLDLTSMDSDSVVKIFSALEDGDEIEVVPDQPGKVHFKDNRTNKEYIIMTESELEDELEGAIKSTFDEEIEQLDLSDIDLSDVDFEETDDEDYSEDIMPMDEMDDEDYFEDTIPMDEMDGVDYSIDNKDEVLYELELDEEDDEEDLYELELDEKDEDFYELDEEDEEYMMEAKKTSKPKGMGFGSAQSYKMSKTPNMDGGFKVVKRNADKTMGTGSAKKANIYKKDSPSFDGDFNHKPTKSKTTKGSMNFKPKKSEFKEASRTLGSGSNFRHGGLPKPRAHSGFNANIKESYNDGELQILREKNEEYRKALNVFRTKLNEVAVFNSNLAYATRLFTEHSTSKQEKIEILKRFDNVQNLKESKNLYRVIKDELSSTKAPQKINESIERTIQKTPSNGSAINLIESKTYENPQFLRMKDLMSKLK